MPSGNLKSSLMTYKEEERRGAGKKRKSHMVVKQSSKTKAKTPVVSAKPSAVTKGAEKPRQGSNSSVKKNSVKESHVAGWLQDASLEAPASGFGYEAKPGEREVEFSVAMRHRKEAGQDYAELRGRALIHAGGTVLALAEASYVAEIKEKSREAEMVSAMYPALKEALQSLLQLAGHTPPLPESLESAAS